MNDEQIIEAVEVEAEPNPFAHLSVCIIAHKSDKKKLTEQLIPSLPKGCEIIIVENEQGEDSDPVIVTDESVNGIDLLVAEYTWAEFDFSVARNYSLGFATREWMLVVDTDDILNPCQHSTLANLVHVPAGVGALMVTVAGMQPAMYQGDEAKHYANPSHRLIRNGKGFHYRSRCHENVTDSVIESGYTMAASTLVITHMGYAITREELLRKFKRNVVLLTKQLTEQDTEDEAILELLCRDSTNYLALKKAMKNGHIS